MPGTSHGLETVHTTGVPAQAPAWQASPFVQASPSSHAVPSAVVAHVPVDGVQVPG